MGHMYWLTNTQSQAERVGLALAERRRRGDDLAATVVRITDANAERWATHDWSDASLVVISLMGGHAIGEPLGAALAAAEVPHWVYLTHGPEMYRRQEVTAAQEARIEAYLNAGGMANYEALWQYLAGTFLGREGEIPAPMQQREEGLYYPGEDAYGSLAEYRARHWQPDRYTVGFFFLRDDWLWGKTEFYDTLIREIEAAGMNVLALFTHWGKTTAQTKTIDVNARAYFCDETGATVPDVLINHHRMSMRLGRATDPDFLANLGVPVLQAYHARRGYDEWRASSAGLTPTEVSSTVAMIEHDGIVHGPVVSHQETDTDGTAVRAPWMYGIRLLVARCRRWARLGRLPNAEKKVALILHNYPANNAHVGCAADLDSPASLWRILQRLEVEGYDVGTLPPDPAALWQQVMSHMTNDRTYAGEERTAAATHIAGPDVEAYERTLAPAVRTELAETWGEAPGDVMADDEGLILPGFVTGNIYIGLQPPRGFGENPSAIIHSPTMPPTHHYLAFYHYLQTVWGADAYVHIGTHGSQEWLPGKRVGLSDTCYPLLTMDEMPNLYPYLVTIIGEGIQAKRRGYAALVGYLPAPAAPGGLYGRWEEMEPLLDEYTHAETYQPDRIDTVLESVDELIEALGMTEHFAAARAASAQDYILAIHLFMESIAHRASRTGLHILGQAPEGAELLHLVEQVTGVPQAEQSSLPERVAAALGESYPGLLVTETLGAEELAAQARVREATHAWLEALAAADWNAAEMASTDVPLTDDLAAAAQTIATVVVPRIKETTREIDAIAEGLAGGFIEPSPGGSPSSGNLDVLPTGRNFFGIDPSRLPTPTAWDFGVRLGDELVERYVADEGRYPETVGIIVWAGPNLRSNGQCLAEILYLLGVRPIWRKDNGKIDGLELIPTAELGRPRIDVTARISGLVRDVLPQAVSLVNRAVALVAALDEPDELNYLAKHVRADAAAAEAEGIDPETALRRARWRVFGCPPGAYGAGVGALLDQKNWETDDDLAATYVTWGGYAYDEDGEAHADPQSFRRRLASVDVTVKNEDTRDLNLMSSDDFNAYHGGMIAAVRAIGGRKPRSYVGDTSARTQVAVRTLAEEFQQVVQGESLNPQFIKGMMKHGYKGALELAKQASFAYGWDATSRVMNDALYNRIAESYVLDETVRQWMREVNPWALHEITETLFEAQRRGFWNMTDEMADALREIYLSTEGELEEQGETNTHEP